MTDMAELKQGGKEKSDAKQGPKPRLGDPLENRRLDCELKNLLANAGIYNKSRAYWKRIMEIIEDGADVNARARTMDKSTALNEASMAGELDVCQFLLEKGARIDPRDRFGETPLMKAAGGGHPEICELLVEKGADVNVANIADCTALMYAAKDDDMAACKILLKNGANLWARDVCKNNALGFARNNNSMDAFYFLEEWALRKIVGKAAGGFAAVFRECVKV
jgi:ankyrin repeat protein